MHKKASLEDENARPIRKSSQSLNTKLASIRNNLSPNCGNPMIAVNNKLSGASNHTNIIQKYQSANANAYKSGNPFHNLPSQGTTPIVYFIKFSSKIFNFKK